MLDESTDIESLIRPSPIHITSYLNTLHIREITHNGSIVRLNATVRTQTGNLWVYWNHRLFIVNIGSLS